MNTGKPKFTDKNWTKERANKFRGGNSNGNEEESEEDKKPGSSASTVIFCDKSEEELEEDKKPGKRGSTGEKPPGKKARKGSDESDASEPSESDSEEEYSPEKSKAIITDKFSPKKKKDSKSDSGENWGKSKKGAKKAGGGGGDGGGGVASGGGRKGSDKGYTKTMTLSPELAALVGQDAMTRHEVIKRIWSIVNKKNLYDPNDKQFVICDGALSKVMGIERFRTFGMMKYLKKHFIS